MPIQWQLTILNSDALCMLHILMTPKFHDNKIMYNKYLVVLHVFSRLNQGTSASDACVKS